MTDDIAQLAGELARLYWWDVALSVCWAVGVVGLLLWARRATRQR